MTSNNVVKGDFNKKHLWKIILIVAVVLGLFILKASIVMVDSGEIGVPVLFGKVQNYTIKEGLSVINPLIKVVRYPVRIQEYTMSSQADRGSVRGDDSIDIKTSDGISVKIDMTVWWYIDKDKAFSIYRKIAKDSREIEPKILRPATRAVMRDVAVQFTMEELYTGKRDEFTNKAISRMKKIIEEKNLVLNKVLIRSIKLPSQVEEAISRKMKTKQESDEMEYRKEIAEKTAEIQEIEARGISKRQEIINTTLSPQYIQYRAIDIYKNLVDSKNTTFIVMPTSQKGTGMPVILNSDKK